MRILSQDGLPIRDFPYEKTYLYVDENGKRIRVLFDGIIFDIAEYSTEAKAKRAMEMLRKAYSPTCLINGAVIEPDEIFTNSFIISPTKKSSDIEVETLENFYFQFPSDEELEG